MDVLYADWPTVPISPLDGPDPGSVESMDAFSFGEPARGLRAFRQEWAPALDLFDIDRPITPSTVPFAIAKLAGFVICLTGLAGLLLSTAGRAVAGLLTG